MTETRIGICKICLGYCPIEVTVENGRAAKVVGDRQSPLYGGYTCPKGRALPEAHDGPHRLLHSQRRRPDGTYETIPTEQALAEIAAKIQGLIETRGLKSVAVFTGNGGISSPLSHTMAACFSKAMGLHPDRHFSTLTLDQPGKVIAQALHGRWIPGPHAFADADVWMMVGANPVISKMGLNQNPGQVIKRAVQNGMKLIVVDPRETESTVHAHMHLQPQPGQDPTLLAGILNIILSEKRYDAAFVRENAIGVDDLARHVAPYTPEHVAGVTGLSADQIVQAARTFADGQRGCVITGTGPAFALHGTLVEYLALCINTVCGRWVRAGEKNSQPHVMLPEVAARAQPLAPYMPWDDSVRGRINNLPKNVLGPSAGTLADEILTPGEGQIRALICSGSNPMVSLPDQARAEKALKSLDLLVSLDVEMSNTARLAHYVIPDKMLLETPAVTQLVESVKYIGMWTNSFEQPYAMYAKAVVEPPEGADVLEIWQFYYEVAKRLGKQIVFYAGAAGYGRHYEKAPQAIPLPMDRRPSTEEMFELLCTGSRVPLSEVKKYPHGKVYDELDHTILPRDPACTAMLELADLAMMNELDRVFAKRGDTAVPDTDFPLMLIPRRANEVLNSIGRAVLERIGRRTYNPAFLNPADLVKYGLKSGDLIRIRSRHGEIIGIAAAEERLRPGTLSMSHGYGQNPEEESTPHDHGACTSRLMDANAEYDPIFGQPRMGAIPVAIALAA